MLLYVVMNHPTNLEIILEDAKIIENRACRDSLLNAVSCYHGPSRQKLLAALDEPFWQPPFFQLLRKAISNHEPVESISLQAFAGPAFLPAFLEIGSALMALSHDIKEVRALAAAQGLFETDLDFRYLRENWSMLLHVFASMRLGRLFLPDYDPRCFLQNNGGALYEERFQKHTLRTLYTPTPTIGNTIAPELVSCLEALKKGAPFQAFSYVNLQDITSHDEGYRVQSIMRLNEQFPDIFFGITLPQNTGYFEDEHASPLQLKEELLNPCNFSLENRMRRGDPGYYFPGGQARWEKTLLNIFDRAYGITQNKQALVELVHLAIIRHHQMTVLQRGSVLSTIACKESIDRGGKINAELLWAIAPQTKPMDLVIFSMFQARALLTRKRFIVASRADEMQALLMHVNREEAHLFLHDICSEFKVDSSKIEFL